jgi:CoA:oxalate CoA-transferase
MNRSLAAVRVLDLTNVLAGPFCAYQLALMGADVLKIETPDGGDLARQLGADAALNARRMGASFLAQNAGKRSLTLNLKAPEGKEVLRRLVREADVLVENFRPGVMARLGLSWDELKAVNPKLVYCAISGFGQDGPLKASPAYDQIIQGLSGMMSVTGSAECAPMRAGFPVADTLAGITAAFAIAAALVGRAQSGEGTFIDGVEPQAHGNDNFTAAPSGAFRAQDGLINIAANKQEQFEALADLLGLPALKTDDRFATREARKRNRAALTAVLEQALRERRCVEWETLLNRAGIPAGCVLTVPQALRSPQVQHRELLRRFEATPGVERPVTVARAGFTTSSGRPDVELPPPQLGQDTEAVLASLGYGAEEIRRLREARIV